MGLFSKVQQWVDDGTDLMAGCAHDPDLACTRCFEETARELERLSGRRRP
jgi:hypothetical protein